MTINDWVDKVHNLASEKGWHLENESEIVEDGKLSPQRKLALHMLIVTEVAEASEEVRNNKPDLYWETPTGRIVQDDVAGGFNLSVGTQMQKPEGEMAELADVVIRVMDIFGLRKWDLEKAIRAKHDYNITRALKHGGKAL